MQFAALSALLPTVQVAPETQKEFAAQMAEQMKRKLERKSKGLEWQLRLEAAAAGVRSQLA